MLHNSHCYEKNQFNALSAQKYSGKSFQENLTPKRIFRLGRDLKTWMGTVFWKKIGNVTIMNNKDAEEK
jgi:hypothetical protein